MCKRGTYIFTKDTCEKVQGFFLKTRLEQWHFDWSFFFLFLQTLNYCTLHYVNYKLAIHKQDTYYIKLFEFRLKLFPRLLLYFLEKNEIHSDWNYSIFPKKTTEIQKIIKKFWSKFISKAVLRYMPNFIILYNPIWLVSFCLLSKEIFLIFFQSTLRFSYA